MRLKMRIHEWLADHVAWIQYPDARFPERSLMQRYHYSSTKQKAWFWVCAFWASMILLSIYGNLI